MKHKQFKEMMEPMLHKYILPELFNTQQGLLRSRACWLYGEMGFLEFKIEGHLKQSLEGICKCLQEDDLPVKLSAAVALKGMLRKKEVKSVIQPDLPKVLETYLKIMEEIESEELVSALEDIVGMFKDDIEPFAINLTN
jgi:hypothetical protein